MINSNARAPNTSLLFFAASDRLYIDDTFYGEQPSNPAGMYNHDLPDPFPINPNIITARWCRALHTQVAEVVSLQLLKTGRSLQEKIKQQKGYLAVELVFS